MASLRDWHAALSQLFTKSAWPSGGQSTLLSDMALLGCSQGKLATQSHSELDTFVLQEAQSFCAARDQAHTAVAPRLLGEQPALDQLVTIPQSNIKEQADSSERPIREGLVWHTRPVSSGRVLPSSGVHSLQNSGKATMSQPESQGEALHCAALSLSSESQGCLQPLPHPTDAELCCRTGVELIICSGACTGAPESA